jgi:hypothetical protein
MVLQDTTAQNATAENILERGQQQALDSYELMVDTIAFSTKAYWAMWGPLGLPAIDAIDRWAKRQREYLQAVSNET